MADNRMYLRCKGCGATFFLGKRIGGGYYIRQYEQYKGVPLMERLNKFYDDHEWCGEAGLDCFELIYEEPPKPLTNADRLRARSDEELAEWLDNIDTAYEPETVVSRRGWLYWLRQEVQDDV